MCLNQQDQVKDGEVKYRLHQCFSFIAVMLDSHPLLQKNNRLQTSHLLH